MKKRRKPLRKCTGCGQSRPKAKLIRVVKTNDNEIVADFTGKVNGRGAYICPDIGCLDKAIESNQIARSLKKEVPLELLEELREILDEDLKVKKHLKIK